MFDELLHSWGTSRFAGGVHPSECKESTEGKGIRRLPFAPELVIPLSQHIGAPAVSLVDEGQEVVRGEPIAKAGAFVSVPMHAPVTGVVDRIALVPNAQGGQTQAIHIKSHMAADQQILYGGPRDIESMSPEDLVKAVQDTGVVGLGGAAFPTHVKLAVPEGKSVDTVIVNGCECEPYLTTDHRVMLERPRDVLAGIRIVARALGTQRVVVGIEENKRDAAKVMKAALRGEDGIAVDVLPVKYPQGAEKMLVKALLGREIPPGGLPADVGAAVFNVATLAQIGDLLPRQQGLIERVVTITGPGVKEPGNYLMALGTPLRFALKQAGALDDVSEVILGGPMMGAAVGDLNVPTTKGISGILVLSRNGTAAPSSRVYPCIKCGQCVDVCPMRLNPSRLGLLARKGRYAVMDEEFNLKACFECGCCSYVCPSRIPLVQLFRVAKATNREMEVRT